MIQRFALSSLLLLLRVNAWLLPCPPTRSLKSKCGTSFDRLPTLLLSSKDEWQGEVVSNTQGEKITGCSLQQVEGSTTDWIISIDGVEADLARFSEAIYKKIMKDAKQQRFQGFRPGTIPPHLEPTYRAFTMDECARETVLEAMQQNNIRPFESNRSEMELVDFRVPPPLKNASKKKKKRSVSAEEAEPSSEPEWLFFPSMKEAIDAGWKPGQSFSFVAKKVKGQKVKDEQDLDGAQPLGAAY